MPAVAFLDEKNERFLYEKLRASGIAFVSVGHRSTLKEFHDTLLVLKNDGTSKIAPLPEPAPDQRRTALPETAIAHDRSASHLRICS